jgi:hypothetical protein
MRRARGPLIGLVPPNRPGSIIRRPAYILRRLGDVVIPSRSRTGESGVSQKLTMIRQSEKPPMAASRGEYSIEVIYSPRGPHDRYPRLQVDNL